MFDFHIVVIFNDYYTLIIAFLTKQIQNRYRNRRVATPLTKTTTLMSSEDKHRHKNIELPQSNSRVILNDENSRVVLVYALIWSEIKQVLSNVMSCYNSLPMNMW